MKLQRNIADIMKENNKNQKDKSKLSILLAICAIVLAVLEYFALVNSNFLLYNLGNFGGKLILTLLPLLSVAVFIAGTVLFFNKKDVKYIVAVGLTLICTVAAFALSNTGSNSKITSDFLKNEQLFNRVANEFIDKTNDANSSFFTVNNKELKNIINCKKAEVISVGDGKSAVFFYAFEDASRTEGYVYLPDKIYPIAWDVNPTEWSDPLDISETWWYICIYK